VPVCYPPMTAMSAEPRGAEQARRILAVVRALAPGEVLSYGAVARRAGFPRGARLAARALSTNDDPALPWHRVLRADGRIAFPAGSAMFREQCRRLAAEGVVVRKGRVRQVAEDAPGALDRALWG
jgi:methylated-DNA-protein-cysteine methyltransferase related protein